MITILMMSAKMVTLGLLKTKVSWNKSYDLWFLPMVSPAKFYHVPQIVF